MLRFLSLSLFFLLCSLFSASVLEMLTILGRFPLNSFCIRISFTIKDPPFFLHRLLRFSYLQTLTGYPFIFKLYKITSVVLSQDIDTMVLKSKTCFLYVGFPPALWNFLLFFHTPPDPTHISRYVPLSLWWIICSQWYRHNDIFFLERCAEPFVHKSRSK